jgi:anti-sigma factor RsiW
MTEMDCDELVELVTAFLDEALDPETERRVEDHLAQCDGCDAFVEQVRATIRSAGLITPGTLDPATRESLLGAFRKLSR